MDPGAGGGLASEAMPTRFWVRSRGRSGRRGLVMQALCGFLAVGLPLSTAHAQSPAAAAGTGNSGSQSDRAATIGGGLLIGGVAAAIGGLYLVMTSSTTVVSSTGATFSRNDDQVRPRAKSSVALTPRGLTF